MFKRSFDLMFLQPTSLLLLAAVLLHNTDPVVGLSCPCDKNLCPNVTSLQCQYGTVYDVCLCCLECAKGTGEVCGGIWGSVGTCTNNNTCLVNVPFGSSYSTYLHTNGHCIAGKLAPSKTYWSTLCMELWPCTLTPHTLSLSIAMFLVIMLPHLCVYIVFVCPQIR